MTFDLNWDAFGWPHGGPQNADYFSIYGYTAALAVLISIMALLFSFMRHTLPGFRHDHRLNGLQPATKTEPVCEKLLPHGQVRVSRILIHPIKSCRGLSVQSADYTPEGLKNDRLWSIIDADKLRIITARDVPKMVLITPEIYVDGTMKISFPADSGCESFSILMQPPDEELRKWIFLPNITIWPKSDFVDGYICESTSGVDVSSSTILSKYFEKPVHLVFKGPRPRPSNPTTRFPELKATAKYQDMYPLLILSEESTTLIEEELQGHVGTQGIDLRWKTQKVVIERFRPNIIVQGGGPFAEDRWTELSIGSEDAPCITLVSKCARCLLPNVSPQTGERDQAVPYKVLLKFRTGLDPEQKLKPCVGCNAVPDGNGVVRVGDWVYLKR